MSKNNQSGATTGGRNGNSPGEGPSANNGYEDSRSDQQLVKDGGWESKYHMMQSYGLSVNEDRDWKVADQIIEGFRKNDLEQARAEASDHQAGATSSRGYGGQDAYTGAQGRDGGSQDSHHPYDTSQYGGHNQYAMVAQSRDSGRQQVDDEGDDDDEDEDDDSEGGYYEENVGDSGYFEGGGNDYNGDYTNDDDGNYDYNDGDEDGNYDYNDGDDDGDCD